MSGLETVTSRYCTAPNFVQNHTLFRKWTARSRILSPICSDNHGEYMDGRLTFYKHVDEMPFFHNDRVQKYLRHETM
jgi:hypothetical protein